MKKKKFDIIDKIVSDDVELLKRSVEEVKSKINERKDLARELMSQLNSDIHDLAMKEENLKIWGPGYKSSIDRSRDEIKRQNIILRNEARDAEINFWKDTTALEKELRILLQAYEKAKRRRDFLNYDNQEK